MPEERTPEDDWKDDYENWVAREVDALIDRERRAEESRRISEPAIQKEKE